MDDSLENFNFFGKQLYYCLKLFPVGIGFVVKGYGDKNC